MRGPRNVFTSKSQSGPEFPGAKAGKRASRIWIFAVAAAVPLVLGAALVISDGDSPVSDSGPAVRPTGVTQFATLTGLVTAPDGRPVADAAVRISSVDEPPLAVPELGVRTGPAGRYEWQLRPGRYEVTVVASGATATKTTTVHAGGAATLDFILPRGE